MSQISLKDLIYGDITETISVTYSEKKGYNVAPIGVISKDGKIYAKLYSGSDTIENVKNTKEIVINFTRDPIIYVEGALSDRADKKIKDGRLKNADAWVKCTAKLEDTKIINDKKREKNKKIEKWTLNEKKGEILEKKVVYVNRGFNAIIEATVYATRLDFNPNFREKIKEHIEIAKKCGGKREEKAANLMEKLINI